MNPEMPRLALISDVAPEMTVAGKRLLYRLLRSYDPSRLTVIEGDIWPTDPALRLPGVSYQTLAYKPKYYDTRLNACLGLVNLFAIGRYAESLRKIVFAHNADAILTVAHGHLWLVAAKIASRCELPLHLIIHDDWPNHVPVPFGFRGVLHKRFESVYKQAASRFCVSKYMEAEYRERYGTAGSVLPASRGEDSPEPRLRMRDRRSGQPMVVAFAGSLDNADYIDRLSMLAVVLNDRGGELHVYSNVAQGGIAHQRLGHPNISFHGFLPPIELAERLKSTADVLLVPLSFAPSDAKYMQTAFPSKLVEYTAIGIPILIWGPTYAAAVKWGLEFEGAVEVVTDPTPAAIAHSLSALARNPERARRMAEAAMRIGDDEFCFEKVSRVFRNSLLHANQ